MIYKFSLPYQLTIAPLFTTPPPPTLHPVTFDYMYLRKTLDASLSLSLDLVFLVICIKN